MDTEIVRDLLDRHTRPTTPRDPHDVLTELTGIRAWARRHPSSLRVSKRSQLSQIPSAAPQPEWGEQRVSHQDTFLGFACELGLDVAAFETALDARATRDRVRADHNDGANAGVRGTPTFFINGTKFTGKPSYEGLKPASTQLARRPSPPVSTPGPGHRFRPGHCPGSSSSAARSAWPPP
ncbi:hypothetical protein CFN78_16375 [Amycolatopsis antarctica]|uniref:DSBA-like thioredoxin domain-containing protein n=1 Tax=Amycolatopsis antarctica TaxID=1854586 RepID=A0A263D3T3_9PSEU|nr:DsbA family protein [Amycolatopsis antarctica]OZM72116.1 hypothetical protein CFN78_16375 [Amycolatopsis antarctica]